MADRLPTELPELIQWLRETIEPVQDQSWQITLNSSGTVVEATYKIVQSRQDNGRGMTTTISRVTNARFRLGRTPTRRTVFRTE